MDADGTRSLEHTEVPYYPRQSNAKHGDGTGAYYRFLETEDEYFDYAPAAIPPQGRWKI